MFEISDDDDEFWEDLPLVDVTRKSSPSTFINKASDRHLPSTEPVPKKLRLDKENFKQNSSIVQSNIHQQVQNDLCTLMTKPCDNAVHTNKSILSSLPGQHVNQSFGNFLEKLNTVTVNATCGFFTPVKKSGFKRNLQQNCSSQITEPLTSCISAYPVDIQTPVDNETFANRKKSPKHVTTELGNNPDDRNKFNNFSRGTAVTPARRVINNINHGTPETPARRVINNVHYETPETPARRVINNINHETPANPAKRVINNVHYETPATPETPARRVVNNLYHGTPATPARRVINNVDHGTPARRVKRKFPGPAGRLPKLQPGEPIVKNSATSPEAENKLLQNVIQCSQAVDDGFNETSWQKLIQDLGQEAELILDQFSVAASLQKASKKLLPRGKIPLLFVMVESIDLLGVGGSVVLKDKTGKIKGTLHRDVIKEYGGDIQAGTTLVLRQVGVVSPTSRTHYLNITPTNMVYLNSNNININKHVFHHTSLKHFMMEFKKQGHVESLDDPYFNQTLSKPETPNNSVQNKFAISNPNNNQKMPTPSTINPRMSTPSKRDLRVSTPSTLDSRMRTTNNFKSRMSNPSSCFSRMSSSSNSNLKMSTPNNISGRMLFANKLNNITPASFQKMSTPKNHNQMAQTVNNCCLQDQRADSPRKIPNSDISTRGIDQIGQNMQKSFHNSKPALLTNQPNVGDSRIMPNKTDFTNINDASKIIGQNPTSTSNSKIVPSFGEKKHKFSAVSHSPKILTDNKAQHQYSAHVNSAAVTPKPNKFNFKSKTPSFSPKVNSEPGAGDNIDDVWQEDLSDELLSHFAEDMV